MPHPWLDPAEYPFQSRYLELTGTSVHYLDEGEGENLFFVHGVPAWSFLYRRLIRALSPRYRCLALDLPGFGLSAKPGGFDYSPANLARVLSAFTEALALDRATLVLHDWGGPIGLAWAFSQPERVERLMLMNTWCWPVQGDKRQALVGRLLASRGYAWLEQRFNFTARAFVRQGFADPGKLTPALHRHYLAPLADANRESTRTLARAIWEEEAWLADLWQQRHKLQGKPAAIAWGLADRAFTPRDLERLQGAFPAARVKALPGVGHFPCEEAPQAVQQVLEDLLAEPGALESF